MKLNKSSWCYQFTRKKHKKKKKKTNMGSKMIIGAICILFLATQTHAADFNVKKYGAKADGKSDDAPAFTAAWKEACAATDASKIVIPGGTYLVGSVTFKGPCKAPITIQLSGTLKAPTDTNKFQSQDGWFLFIGIDGLTMNGGGTFDGQGKQVWANTKCPTTGKCNYPTSLRFTSITNSIIRDITSLDSKFFHVNILNCKNMTLQHITITAPGDSPNTDGIHVGRSTGINITDTNIGTGDDCVSLGDGSQQINVERVKCGPGHGISIGSLGKYHNEQPVTRVTVKSCNLTNTMWGARVKTWPASPSGVASDLHFEDLTMNNVSLPILIDQEYCPWSKCNLQQPSRVRISNVSFRRIRGTSATQLAVKLLCSKGVPCQKVDIADIDITYNGKEGPATSECANVKPTMSGKQNPPSCGTKSP